MTKDKALQLLAKAAVGDSPSRINKDLTKTQAVNIVTAGIEDTNTPQDNIGKLFEKRVWQVVKNQTQPRY